MQKVLSLKLLPSDASNDGIIKYYISEITGTKQSSVSGYNILKRSIDARSKQPWINLSVQAFLNEPWQQRKLLTLQYRDTHTANRKVTIVGGGPAGLFAALRLRSEERR